jgi:hypothetical protein
MSYFITKVDILIEDDKGFMKKNKQNFLVDAVSVTDAETKITQYLVERGEKDFDILSVVTSNIKEIVV